MFIEPPKGWVWVSIPYSVRYKDEFLEITLAHCNFGKMPGYHCKTVGRFGTIEYSDTTMIDAILGTRPWNHPDATRVYDVAARFYR